MFEGDRRDRSTVGSDIILDCKVFKLKRFSSVTRNVSVKHPILNQNLIQKPAKIEIFPPNKIFLSGLDQNKLKLYVFEMDFMTNQLKLTVPKICGFRS